MMMWILIGLEIFNRDSRGGETPIVQNGPASSSPQPQPKLTTFIPHPMESAAGGHNKGLVCIVRPMNGTNAFAIKQQMPVLDPRSPYSS